MFKDMTLGSYFPGDSVIHRLDPRAKLLLVMGYIAAVFIVKDIVMYAPVALFVAMVTLVSRVPLSYLIKSLKPLRWLLVLMFILNVFLTREGEPLLDWRFIHITHGGLVKGVYIILRLVLLVGGTSLLTLTTTPVALTDGLESLLTPLKALKFPAHELAMMMTIALRFIPTLLEEADKIMKAQTARGANFETGGVLKRAKAMVPVLVPLFVSAFRRADELAMAMESRCYHGGEGRTKLHVLRFAARDGAAVAVMGALIAVIAVGQRLW